jgi:hypothetical protein
MSTGKPHRRRFVSSCWAWAWPRVPLWGRSGSGSSGSECRQVPKYSYSAERSFQWLWPRPWPLLPARSGSAATGSCPQATAHRDDRRASHLGQAVHVFDHLHGRAITNARRVLPKRLTVRWVAFRMHDLGPASRHQSVIRGSSFPHLRMLSFVHNQATHCPAGARQSTEEQACRRTRSAIRRSPMG